MPVVSSTAIPIKVRDRGPFVHYPASVEDLRGVIAGIRDPGSRVGSRSRSFEGVAEYEQRIAAIQVAQQQATCDRYGFIEPLKVHEDVSAQFRCRAAPR